MMISVDPGVNGTGVCEWDEENIYSVETIYANRLPQLNLSWESRAWTIADRFGRLLDNAPSHVNQIVIERPILFGGAKGRAVAASGDLIKLAMITGMLFAIAYERTSRIRLVAPNEWKGQLPKSVCEARIRKKLGKSFPEGRQSEHAIDAIGIGLWYQGRFK